MTDANEPHPDQVEATYARGEFLGRAGKILAAAALVSPLAAADIAGAAPRSAARAASSKLDVWYLTGSPQEIKYITALTKRFGTAHHVGTSVTPYDYDPINRALKLALNAHKGPDVAYANAGPDDGYVYQKNHWIIDLQPYANRFGWAKRFSPSVMNYFLPLCCGGLKPRTSIPYDLVTVGWFYNPQIFAKYGLKPPTTFPQLQTLLSTLKAKGVTPFSAGGLNIANPGALHYVFEQLVAGLVARATLQRLLLLDPKVSWDQPGVVQALTLAQQWMRNGYVEPNALATSGSDADAMFVNGEAAMTLNGTWKTQQFLATSKFTPRFFPTPRINSHIPWSMGGYTPNNSWMVSAFADDKDLAAAYVDYMLGPQVATLLWNNSDIPAYKFKKTPAPKSKLQADVYAAMQKTQTGFYLSGSGFFGSQYQATLQKAFALSSSPQDVAKELQQNYMRTVNGG